MESELRDEPFCGQIQSIARSTHIHTHEIIDFGNLLKENNGDITATGKEDDPQTFFMIYKFTIEGKLAYKIQSVQDKTYLAIDEKSEKLIMKSNPDCDTLFWVHKVPSTSKSQSPFRVFQSVTENSCYIRVVDPCGTVISVKLQDKEEIQENINFWFQVQKV